MAILRRERVDRGRYDPRGKHRAVARDGDADLDVGIIAGGIVRRRPRLFVNAFDDLCVIRRRRAAVARHVNRRGRG